MNLLRRPGQPRTAFFGIAALLLLLIAALALASGPWLVLAGALASGVFLLATVHQLLAQAEARASASEVSEAGSRVELQKIRAIQESRSTDLALLGRYGNLLLACTDLAEALQISEQMLSLLLPDCAGTIYPLIDGEGLAEATRLWGTHVGGTRAQASAEDCFCMQLDRLYLGSSAQPETLCAHVQRPVGGTGLSAACIPLVAQGTSLGWIYLSAPGTGGIPKLQMAVAAADQLALALANLRLRENLRDLSVRDPLTGLFNRRYLSESLGREISRSRRRTLPLAVLAFDLDRFKQFNDRYGHPAGDAMLVAFGRVLRSRSRSEDIACRQGGEEFVLIMPEMERAVAMRRADELLKAMASLNVMHEGRTLPALTTSIGLAMYPDHGESQEALLAQADQALYRAKGLGRNQIAVANAF